MKKMKRLNCKYIGAVDDDFKYIEDALDWVNKNNVEVLCISEWQFGYTLFYYE